MKPAPLPRHVAIIMDGNGRWARRRGLPRLAGHRQGAQSVRDIVRAAREVGLKALTLYAFSSQNWDRPLEEVHGLMMLLRDYVIEERAEIMDNGIRLTTVGSIERLPAYALDPLRALMADSAHNQDMVLCLALSYGGRDSIVAALQNIARAVQDGALKPDQVDVAEVAAAFQSHALPPLDLVIRTSGELRISNFLLWEAAHAAFHTVETLWPDFSRKDLYAILEQFRPAPEPQPL